MKYNLSLKFEGLSAFLPAREIKGKSHVDWVTVFMVDARTPDPRFFCSHAPEVVFPLIAQQGQDYAKIADNARVHWPLEQVDVFIRIGAMPPTGVYVNDGTVSGERPQPGAEEQYFSWVPSLEGALPSGGYIADDCLGEVPIEDRVVARIHLEYGNLFVKKLVEIHDHISVHQVAPSEEVSPLRQALAAEVQLDINDIEDPVRVGFRNFVSGEWRELTLEPSNGAGLLEVRFNNLCNSLDYNGLGGRYDMGRDDDFVLFYLLSSLNVSKDDLIDLPAPVPVRYTTGGEGGGLFKRCTEAQLAPLDDARREAFEDVKEGMISQWSISSSIRKKDNK